MRPVRSLKYDPSESVAPGDDNAQSTLYAGRHVLAGVNYKPVFFLDFFLLPRY